MADSVPPASCRPAHQVDKAIKLIRLGPGEGHKQTASVLLLHGFGDTAGGWFDLAMWLAERLPHVQFVLPTAPVNQEMGATAWFTFSGPSKATTLAQSVETLQKLMMEEEKAVGMHRVVIAGFSQGGVLAYHLGLQRAGEPVGGVLAMSTWLPREQTIGNSSSATPVLICHGTDDDRIGAQAAEQARDRLTSSGLKDVTLKMYEGLGHSACDVELLDALEWLQRVVPKSADAVKPQSRL